MRILVITKDIIVSRIKKNNEKNGVAGEAGSVWRNDRLKEFCFQVRCMGLEDDPAYTHLLSQIEQHTNMLEELYEDQKKPEYEVPWWQDGEYDDARADDANEVGTRYFTRKQYGDAFDAFTEAIRLNPRSPIYAANRSAAALRLLKPELALFDAQHAIARDSTYVKGYLRGGQAALALMQPDEAFVMYERALSIDNTIGAALKGLEKAKLLKENIQSRLHSEKEAAASGSRPALSRHTPVTIEAATQLLHTAREMLRANPDVEAAKVAHAEALLLCHRYSDAMEACCILLPSPDADYLKAEIAWRQGDVEEALFKYIKHAAQVEKIVDLHTFLRALHEDVQEARVSFEEGEFQQCVEACSHILTYINASVASGLYCSIMTLRGKAFAEKGMHDIALEDLSSVLQQDSLHGGALHARSQVYQSLGRHTDAFLDLQKLKKVAPGTPGLSESIEEAARRCLRRKDQTGGHRASKGLSRVDAAVLEACSVLNITEAASSAEIRKAYLALAAIWHPDKWSSDKAAEKLQAEERFKEIQNAYDILQDLL